MSDEIIDLWRNNPDRAAVVRFRWRDLGKALDELAGLDEDVAAASGSTGDRP